MKNNKRVLSVILSVIGVVVVCLSFCIGFLTRPKTKFDSSTDQTVAVSDDVPISERGGALYIGSGSTYVMTSGTIKGAGEGIVCGGAVFVESGATFKMTGGTIEESGADYGGAIFVEDGATCIIEAGTIKNCTASSDGGGIYVEKGGTLTITGGELSKNIATNNGGAIYSLNEIEISEGIKISGNNATYGGGIYAADALTVTGGLIDGNTATYGGGIYAADALTVTGGLIDGNTASYGAGIGIANSATVSMTGGTVSNNTSSNYGGGIYIEEGSSSAIFDATVDWDAQKVLDIATVTGNKAAKGGGIYLPNGSKTYIYGIVSSNTATNSGGGIYLDGNATVQINEHVSTVGYTGTVSSNTATYGGGIYAAGSSIIELYAGYILGNTATQNGGGVFLAGESTLCKFGFIARNKATYGGGVYASSNADISSYTSSISNNEAVRGGGLYLYKTQNQTIDNYLSGNTATEYGGGIYYEGDNLDSESYVLNNHSTFTKNNAQLGGGIYAKGAIINVVGATFGGSDGNGNTAANGGAVFITNGEINMTSGTMSHNQATSGGGAVYVGSTTPFNFSGGTISNNSAKVGGGVFLSKGSATNSQGILNLTEDAQIVSNSATDGGGVYINNGIANLKSGRISTNSAKNGGGVLVYDGTANLQGTPLESNTSTNVGGGLYINSGKLTIDGSTLQLNTAANDGGAAFVYGGTVTLTSGSITKNEANYGGGIAIKNTGTLTMNGGEISNNVAYIAGGGLRVSNSGAVVSLSGGIINLNYVDSTISGKTWANGGAVWVSDSGHVTVSGATVSNNYLVDSGSLTRPFGGGFYISNSGKVCLEEGTISGNLACPDNENSVGGNVFVGENSYFEMVGGTIEGTKDSDGNYTNANQAHFGGGVGSLGDVYLSGGTISNCCANYGGGIGSYGGVLIDENTVNSLISSLFEENSIDIRANKLTIGSVTISSCTSSDGIGSSIAAGYEIEMFGSPDIDGEISLSALNDVYYKGLGTYSLINESTKHYPEIYVSSNLTPVQNLNISFSQANVEAVVKVSTSGTSYNANYVITDSSSMMIDKFVIEEDYTSETSVYPFVCYKSGVTVDLSKFYVSSDGGNSYYVVAKYKNSEITNTNFDAASLDYVNDNYTGNTIYLLTDINNNNLYEYTLTSDGYTIGIGKGNGIIDAYFDPSESEQTFAVKTATAISSGLNLDLPEAYSNLPVIGVTENGFAGANVISVVMKTTYTTIGANAFSNCENLTNVTVPSSMLTIGEYAFSNCASMDGSIDLSNVEDVGAYAFYGCTSMTGTINLSNVQTIGSAAFCFCYNLTALTDGSLVNVQTIDESAFAFCDKMSGIIDLSSIIEIGNGAFAFCESLTALTDGSLAKAQTIGSQAFDGCTSMTGTIDLSNVQTIGSAAFYGCASLTALTDGSLVNVQTIDRNAFDGCTSMTGTIDLSSVTTLGDYAFNNCQSLSSFNGTNSLSKLTSIGNSVFWQCSSLKGTVDLTNVTSVGNYAFGECSNLNGLVSGSLLEATTIGEQAFLDCSSLVAAIDLSNATTIGEQAFINCSGLTGLTLGENLTTVGAEAFGGLSNLTKLNFNAINMVDISSTSNLIFDGIGSTGSGVTVTVGEYVQQIPAYLLDNNSGTGKVTTINFNGSICTTIGERAFYNCTSLDTIDLSNAVTIEDEAFAACKAIKTLNLSSVTSIGEYAFDTCSAVTTLTLGESLKTVRISAFANMNSLTKLNFNAVEMTDLEADNNVFYNAGAATNEGFEVIIGVKVTKIPAYLFKPVEDATSEVEPYIKTVEFYKFDSESKCETIGKGAFWLVDTLASITLPTNLKKIDASAFRACALTSDVVIPDSVTTIGERAFQDCKYARNLTIGTGLTSLGTNAFNCFGDLNTEATTITFNATAMNDLSINNHTFGYAKASKLIIGANVKKIPAYLFCPGIRNWAGASNYGARMDIDISEVVFDTSNTSLTSIGYYAFAYCTNLTSIEIPNCIEIVNKHAFSGCTSLNSVTLGSKLETIGSAVFKNCSSLTKITIPDSVTGIGPYVFKDCTSLTKVIMPAGLQEFGTGTRALTDGTDAFRIFSGCTSLETIAWSDKASCLNNVGNNAFNGYDGQDGCVNLKTLKMPSSMNASSSSQIPYVMDVDALTPLIALTTLSLGLIYQTSLDNLNVSHLKETLQTLSLGDISYCKTIPESKFQDFKKLTTLTSYATTISDASFYGCTALKEVEIPNVTYIGICAFAQSGISGAITIPTSVKKIDICAFSDCKSITSVDLSNVTSLGSGVFKGCTGLTTATLPTNASFTTIPPFTFAESGLQKLTIPDNVTSIKPYAFASCESFNYLFVSDTSICEYYDNDNLSGKFSDADELVAFLGFTTALGAAVGISIGLKVLVTTVIGLTIAATTGAVSGAAAGAALGLLITNLVNKENPVVSAFIGCKRASFKDNTDGLTIHYNSLHTSLFYAAKWRCLDTSYDGVFQNSDCARLHQED